MTPKLVDTMRDINNGRHSMAAVGKIEFVRISILLEFQTLVASMIKISTQTSYKIK